MFNSARFAWKFFPFFLLLLFFELLMFRSVTRAEVTIDGTLGGAPITLAGPDFQINADYGKMINSTNLFHSFGKFSVDTGQSAVFTGPSTIQNVVARITGRTLSSIDGLIRSTMPAADLYLINPSGFIFGPNAGLDVNGSFHVSTADYISLDNTGVFYADPIQSSVLTVDPPSAFGFLNGSFAGISVNNSLLQVPGGKEISIIGGDLNFTGTPAPATEDGLFIMPGVLSAPGGRIHLVSVASPGEVDLAAGDLGMASFSQLGKITSSEGAKLDVIRYTSEWMLDRAGSIVIRGGKLLFKDGGMDVYGDPGGVVDIKADSLHLDNFYIFAATYGANNHPGTACEIELTDDFLMTHGALIDSQNGPDYVYEFDISGKGGDIDITAANIRLGDDQIDDRSYTDIGFYGYISSACDGSGKSGNINITTDNAVIQNGFSVTTQTFYTGDTGDIVLEAADTLQIFNAANIGILAFAYGNGGNMDISAPDILISAANRSAVTEIDAETGIFSQTDFYWDYSNGGNLNVTADTLRVLDGGRIDTVLYGSGKGADVKINAENILVDGFVVDNGVNFLSSIDGRVYGDLAVGIGGNIDVAAQTLSLTNGGAIRTGLDGGAPGRAGNIAVSAGAIDIASRGRIYADSLMGVGDSGDIGIDARTMTITGAGNLALPDSFNFDFTGLSTSTRDGRGGNIKLALTDDLILTRLGGISADSLGAGKGGDIAIAGQNLTLVDEGIISSTGYGTGDAGDVSIAVEDTLLMRDSPITTEAMHADGGDIFICAPYMIRLVDSKITASVGGGTLTTGGNINIDPRFVVLKGSRIIANAYEGTGGNIDIVSDVFLSDPDSSVDASSSLGIDGQVDIQSPVTHVNSLVSPLAKDFRSVVALLRKPCTARLHKGEYSSFMINGRDSLPVEPGQSLSSPLSMQ